MNAPYLVLTTQRSGSTWLMAVINGMPDAIGQGELFGRRLSDDRVRWDSAFAYPRYAVSHKAVRPLSTWAYLRDFYRQDGHIGFKLMYSQLLRFPEIWVYIQTHRIPVIHLVRQNHLDTLISSRTKSRLGRAHFLDGEQIPSGFTVEVDPRTVIHDLTTLKKRQSTARRVLAWSCVPVLEVIYEDLLNDPSSFRMIWNFLGIDAAGRRPESRLLRIQTRSHAEVVQDFDTVRAVVLQSEFANLLH